MTALRIGTSGWSYDGWKGIFYPEGTRPGQFLEYYASRFDCTELNASFYRLPRPEHVEGWARRTPAQFRFCVKLSRLITHLRRLKQAEEPLAVFFERFVPLTSRMGPVLIQLPPSLAFDAAAARDFFTLLRERHSQYQYALEARHTSWLEDAPLDLLRQHGIALVISDSGGRFPHAEAITAPFTYLRFHGPGGLYASNYPKQALAKYARKIHGWLDRGLQVWGFFNNDVDAHAVRNAETLRGLVSGG